MFSHYKNLSHSSTNFLALVKAFFALFSVALKE
jgi:hypothetical protein